MGLTFVNPIFVFQNLTKITEQLSMYYNYVNVIDLLDFRNKIDVYNSRSMIMRIIAGRNKGTKLFTLDGINTRPTLDRVKEPLFSIINFSLVDSTVLDLFSGSGALALEAISRGAKEAYLCDNSRDAIKIIKQNIEKTKTENQTVVITKTFDKALQELAEKKVKFDIIFLDPPYKTDYAEKATEIIVENDLLKDNGIIIIETDEKNRIVEKIQNIDITMYDERKYGRVNLLFLRKE